MDHERSSVFRTDINGLRAVSVLLVVFFHFQLPGFSGGFIGVDVFFVISGFLMTKIIVTALRKDDFSYARFVAARAARIVPALYVMLALLTLIGLVALSPLDLYNLASQAGTAALFYSNAFFHDTQAYFVSGLDDRWLLHTWSLSVEWQFYLLYPLLLAAAAWLFPERYVLRLILILAAASLAYCVVLTNASPKSAFFLLLPRAWEMLAGGAIFLLGSATSLGARTRAALSYAGLVIIVGASILIGHLELEAAWPGAFATLPVFGACLTIWAAHSGNRVLNSAVSQRIGDASYSIYLYHWPLVVAIHVTSFIHMHLTSARLIGIALSFALGYASYRWIESQRFLRASQPWRTIGIGATACLTLFIGTNAIVASDGVAARTGSLQADHRRFIRTDTSDDSLDACDNNFKAAADWRICILNRARPGRRVLVIGDSHAAHLYPWFIRHAQARTEFFIKRGCPLSPGFNRIEPGYACAEYTSMAYRLASSGRYDTVILSAQWHGGGLDADGLCSSERPGCVPPRALPTLLAPVPMLEAALSRMMAKGIKVVAVDDTPWTQFNVPRRLSRELYWRGRVTKRIDATEFERGNDEFDALFAKLAQRDAFTLVSLRKSLCDTSTCSIVDARTHEPVLRDRDHFNPAWIIAHGDALKPFVTVPTTATPALSAIHKRT